MVGPRPGDPSETRYWAVAPARLSNIGCAVRTSTGASASCSAVARDCVRGAADPVLEFQAQLYARLIPSTSGDLRRQACVALLPNIIETKVVVSGSLFSWIKFIEARDNADSPGEIRALAKEIARQLADRYPPIFGEEGRALWHMLP
ncbi:FAD-dependent thymidylate synthase [Rhodococcoides fascians]|uniref:FAD-dependent thymidylate synthase n=1 Tax=Rhodococcoides fascians TaxID=1828 RepID=UPI0011A83B27